MYNRWWKYIPWLSPSEIIAEFGLRPAEETPKEILRSVKQELAVIHPDKHNGEFASPEDEERWHKLAVAKQQLETMLHGNTAMIPVHQLPVLFQAIREAIAEPISVRSSRLITESRESIRRAAFFPKLTSGVFAAICAFLATAPKTFKDQPMIDHFISQPFGQTMLLVMMLYSGLLFFCLWLREWRNDQRLEWLLTSEGVHSVLARVLNNAKTSDGGLTFTFKQFVNSVAGRRRSHRDNPLLYLLGGQIGLPILEKTAKLMIDQLKEQQIIMELPDRGLDARYKIPQHLAEEILVADSDLTP